MKCFFICSLLSLFSFNISYAGKEGAALKKVLKAEHRSEQNKNRDVYRNPYETLKFFEVKPGMKVIEVSPGGGWYTEILSPYIGKKGELILTIFSDQSKRSYAPKLNKRIRSLVANKKVFKNIKFVTMETPSFVSELAEKNSMDRVLTFRNVHGWMKDGKAKEVFQKFYDALKPGGILGVVEHRAKNNKKQDPKSKNGYVREDYVIELAKSVGFKFVAKSEVNANYHDSADHPKGVWTLPPSFRGKKEKRSFYEAIGESDRMTVKFVKP